MPQVNLTLTVEQRKQLYRDMITHAERMMDEHFNNDNQVLFWHRQKLYYESLLNDGRGA